MPENKTINAPVLIIISGVIILLASFWQVNLISGSIGILLIGVAVLIEQFQKVIFELQMINYNLVKIKLAIPVINPEPDIFNNKQ